MKECSNPNSKRGWIIPLIIVAVNVAAVLIRWSSLPEILPAHFDLQGNASGSMPRSTLIIYPVISLAVCAIAYASSRLFLKRMNKGLIILTSGITLVILSSTLVTLTYGTTPVFMLAEPVILIAALVWFIVCWVKARKQ